jgi:hypothetical protein
MRDDERKAIGSDEEEGVWTIDGGTPKPHPGEEPYRDDGTSALTYNNPYHLEIERVWFDGKIVYAIEQGELDIDPSSVKVAQEYQIVYDVELDARGKPVREPERVPGQYNIYDSVPGMEKYSPLWLFNYVVVPRSYVPNTLRSEKDCLDGGYRIVKSTVIEN